MGRSKPITRKPINEMKAGHNDAVLNPVELRKAVSSLQRQLEVYQEQEAARDAALVEYEAARTINEKTTAEESLMPPVFGAPKISWTESLTFSSGEQECRRASITIPDDWSKPIIFVKGDEQLGHVTCDEERIKKDIAWVEKNPQCLVMLLGDAIDAATDRSPGSIRENKSAPIRQANQYIDLHRPIRDRVIGYVGGNHERRIDKALSEGGAGVRLIASGLSTPEHPVPFSSGVLLLDLHWKGHLWTFTLFHGAGAAATAGSKVQRLQRNILLSDSLITLSGHLHEELKTSRRLIKRTAEGGIHIAKQTALQCGTYLKYLGSYGEVAGMSPVGPDMIVIELLADG